MRILLTGVTGQVGWELQRSLMTLGEVIPTARMSPVDGMSLDLSQPDEIRRVVQAVRPDLIVNAGAYTAVDRAETEIDLAMAVNAIAPGVLAEEAKRIGAALIHYSTDYVFDGGKASPYLEADAPNPLNIYGKSKLEGERAIAAIEVPHFIFRTTWVYGSRGKNFLRTMLKLAQEREQLKIVDDQIGAPTWCRTIAEVTAQILAQQIANSHDFIRVNSGLYHLTSAGQTTWFQFAKAIFDLTSEDRDRALKTVLPISAAEYPTPAVRPTYSLLDCQKLSRTFGMVLPSWHTALSAVVRSEN